MNTEKSGGVLILGGSGMLGNAVFRSLGEETAYSVHAAVRSSSSARFFPPHMRGRVVPGVDAENFDSLADLMEKIRPAAVINCIGLVKQKVNANDPLTALSINSLLPHRLARLCALSGARLVHISTDCVFDGKRGGYVESDVPNATDLYGRSKLLGEVDYLNTVTLRTSIIGREMGTRNGLIDWFLSQKGNVNGFTEAIFSGLTTLELSRVIARYVLPNPDLCGLYHVSAAPISKYDLLVLVSQAYGSAIEINKDTSLVIDRSLSSEKFRALTGYVSPAWPTLIADLYAFYGADPQASEFPGGPPTHA